MVGDVLLPGSLCEPEAEHLALDVPAESHLRIDLIAQAIGTKDLLKAPHIAFGHVAAEERKEHVATDLTSEVPPRNQIYCGADRKADQQRFSQRLKEHGCGGVAVQNEHRHDDSAHPQDEAEDYRCDLHQVVPRPQSWLLHEHRAERQGYTQCQDDRHFFRQSPGSSAHVVGDQMRFEKGSPLSSVAIVLAVVIVVFIIITATSRPTNANHAGLIIEEGRFVRPAGAIRVPGEAATSAEPALLIIRLHVDLSLGPGMEQEEEPPLAA